MAAYLINTVDELRTVVAGTQSQLDIEVILPFVEQAEIEYLIPEIGQDLYDSLLANLTSTTPKWTTLLAHARRALGYGVMYKAAPMLSVMVGNLGIQEVDTRGTKAAKDSRYYRYERALLQNMELFTDKLLEFLENSADGTYPTWENSSAYINLKECFVNQTAIFDRYVKIHNRRRAYLQVKQYLLDAQTDNLTTALGASFYEEIYEKFLDGDIATPQEKELIKRLQKIISLLGFAESLPEIHISKTEKGLMVNAYSDGIVSENPVSERMITALQMDYQSRGKQALQQTLIWLDSIASASVFPIYFGSTNFGQTQSGATSPFEFGNHNDNLKGSVWL